MSALTVLTLSVFLASLVEGVEAVTIVLAAGSTRGWRSAVQGTLAALLLLGAVVALFGPSLTLIPINSLRTAVGGLLLVFGLQWLRKAILRASGHKALHDEALIYTRELESARAAPVRHAGIVDDWYGFTVAFKGVLLEGLEVVFIVITFGAGQHHVGEAAIAGAAAVLLVSAAGIIIRAPLTRVPENALKFAVGVLITTFGCFWATEGAGGDWPGGDAALLFLLPSVLLVAVGLVAVLRRAHRRTTPQVAAG